ncbi:hypothetical protein B0H17DRAFT_1146275 [Mycena rosella]|uniref:Uncharacterized protein n=1 Tax=Mycena rosella TaxID=1033263 RepID=A0AAD7CP91_MYCRO|nr:hypothetical protein B0H17DRAFT_1146275 [Mycena rosella]
MASEFCTGRHIPRHSRDGYTGSVEHFHQQKQHSFAFSEGRKLNIEMKVGTSPSLPEPPAFVLNSTRMILTALPIIMLGTRHTHRLDDFKSRMGLIYAVRNGHDTRATAAWNRVGGHGQQAQTHATTTICSTIHLRMTDQDLEYSEPRPVRARRKQMEPKSPPPRANSHQQIQFGTSVGVDWPRAAALEPASVESVRSPVHPGEVQLCTRRWRWRAYTRASRAHVPGPKPVVRDSVLAVHHTGLLFLQGAHGPGFAERSGGYVYTLEGAI